MAKYRKKPVEIEAVQWLGTNNAEIAYFMGVDRVMIEYRENGQKLIINTLEGDMEASLGDFIIKGVQGEFYPCKPDIFEQTYEAVE